MTLSKSILTASLLFSLAAAPASAEWLLGPGLSAPQPVESQCQFISASTAEGAYPVYRGGNALTRARINAAAEVEAERFARTIARQNETWKTTGLLSWEEGMDGAYTSFVLIESTYPDRAAHPTTLARGFTFDKDGHQLTLHDLLPNLTVGDVNAAIEQTAAERGIVLFDKHHVGRIPRDFYVGKNGTVYAIFQQYEIAPYAAGIIVVPVGTVRN